MEKIVELYIKIVIATFGFVGPSFSLLMPLFYSAIENEQMRSREHVNNIKHILIGETDINKMIKVLKSVSRENERILILLRPEYQIKQLSIGLGTAILFIGLYYFVSTIAICCGIYVRIGLLLCSGVSFVFSLRVLWLLFCTIIKAKEEEQKTSYTRNDQYTTLNLTQVNEG